jgi:antitoxin component YwqK of YwqJK toxin-antitoxin module
MGMLKSIALSLASLFISSVLADECNFYAKTGAKVSPRSGDCTIEGKPTDGSDGKTGLERCLHRQDKRVVSELNWKNGKRDGAGFYFDNNDRRIVATFNNDLAEGPAQVFSKENKLLCEMEFKGGKSQGAVRELYPSGKLKAAFEINGDREGRGKIELLEDGKIKSLQCASRSMVPQDVEPCGFGGKVSRVQLHNSDGSPIRNVGYWQNGKLTKIETLDREGRATTRTYPLPGEEDTYDVETLHKNGKVFRAFGTKKNRLQGAFREFSEEGTMLRETIYDQEREQSENQFYMNGKLKRSVKKIPGGKQLDVQEFWDNGKIKTAGTFVESQYQSGSWDSLVEEGRVMRYSKDGVLQEERTYREGRFDGDQRIYFASGKLAVEQRYEKDEIRMTKCYDPTGKLELTEEYYEDGSLKAGSTEMSQKQRESKGICRIDR